MSPRFHILRDGGVLTLARHLPPRFDIAHTTTLGPGSALRLAHQIRQDLWRALQSVRGFSPVVRLVPHGPGWQVTAGGRAMVPVTARHSDIVRNTLENVQNRDRWARFAQRGGRR